MDLAIGPYSGEETGETALLRELLDSLDHRDVVVADRPGRIEPRVLKRRRHRYALMQRPRNQLRREVHHSNISSYLHLRGDSAIRDRLLYWNATARPAVEEANKVACPPLVLRVPCTDRALGRGRFRRGLP